jgi:type II secretory pathway pseudopilin PulG
LKAFKMSQSTLKTPSVPAVRSHRGLTVVEIVAVIGIIALLMGILLPALSIAYANARWASSQSNLRQINQLMQEYTADNRETIVPAAFDYFDNTYPGKTRSLDPPTSVMPLGELGQRPNYGTWSDLLWTYSKSGPAPAAGIDPGPNAYAYQYDSPDRVFYDNGGYANNDIFRSTVGMTKSPNGTEALPFGSGARLSEVGDPGYFAANLLFDARPTSGSNLPYVNNYGNWRTTAEVRRPSQTVYIVDSWHGEVIEPTAEGFGSPNGGFGSGGSIEGQVDFRYAGETCLMLFLDGHVSTEEGWDDFTDLESLRNINVNSL